MVLLDDSIFQEENWSAILPPIFFFGGGGGREGLRTLRVKGSTEASIYKSQSSDIFSIREKKIMTNSSLFLHSPNKFSPRKDAIVCIFIKT